MPPVDLSQRQAVFPKERDKWHYIIDTYWAMSPEWLIKTIAHANTLDELYEEARRQRDGMIAT